MESGFSRKAFFIFRFQFFIMKSSWYPICLIAGLLGLLVLLATLQYHWLGKISEGEREQLQKRLQTDTERFAEDFNREIQTAYYTFKLKPDVWREKDWNVFAERFDLWRSKTNYPNLIKDFYFIQKNPELTLWHYSSENRKFKVIQWNDKLNKYWQNDEKNIELIDEDLFALAMPIEENDFQFRQIIVNSESIPNIIEMHKKAGYLVIMLDENVFKNQVFPDLVNKYFSATENGNYNLTIASEKEPSQIIFRTKDEPLSASDSSAKLFNLTPDHLLFLNQEKTATVRDKQVKNIIINRMSSNRTSYTTVPSVTKSIEQVKVDILKGKEVTNEEKPRISLLDNQSANTQGNWILNVQHSAGSLEQFINNTRYKNLFVSFGILSLLAVSIVLIFLSSQRAKQLAQKQIDFVSAVSHEFRTPLAVIYSAGENLTDGVVNSPNQVEKYGNLIKGEGKKLSAMVEQILEFAGARSGKRKYDFRETDVKEVVENALRECQPLIDEKDFTIEKNIAEILPKISADANALSHSIQNLINNSIKYSNGNKWIKISAENGGGKVQIIVEDKGIGISNKEIPYIFEPFYRSKKVVDEQIHGNGLGLSLVKQTIEAHGGKVSVESEIKKGSRFTIELPNRKI
ncbi:MAG: HAMP domain-containing histidine kinase [Acidobacteria bacterium]|nr:HAMP domain-containing histidine kinase [Acidobacteriota bacterium]MCA1639588.1 HAMP domain-containing histidine kinase [Acidobacteriota bacterium]